MGVSTSAGFGQYQAGEGHRASWGRFTKFDSTRRGALLFRGHGTTYANYGPDNLLLSLADRNIVTFGADWGGTATWGNDTAQTRAGTGRTYFNSNFSPKTDKALLMGFSMGALTALLWAKANPTLVAAVALVCPVVDLADVHDNNRAGYATEIETAYGGASGYASAIGTHNPATVAASFVGVPISIWYSTDDSVILPATVTTFAGTSGATATSQGASGHNITDAAAQGAASFLSTYV